MKYKLIYVLLFILAGMSYVFAQKPTEDAAALMQKAAESYKSRDFVKAKEYANNTMSFLSKTPGDNRLTIADCHAMISNCYIAEYEIDKAIESMSKALRLKEEVLGVNSPELVRVYLALSGIYELKMGVDDSAEKMLECLQNALKIQMEVSGENHPLVAQIYGGIGDAYISMDDKLTALDYKNKALQIDLATLGEVHPALSTDYYNVGHIYNLMNQHGVAAEYFEKAIGQLITVKGKDDPSVKKLCKRISLLYKLSTNEGEVIAPYESLMKKYLGCFN